MDFDTETVAVSARVAEGDERTRIWEATIREIPRFIELQARTSREISVVVLERS